MGIFDPWKAKKLLKEGQSAQAQKDLEKAYSLYEQAAQFGNADAMVAIGVLYMRHGFRPVKASNLLHLLAEGAPIFPWNLEETLVPDCESALKWYRKAAEKGHPVGLRLAGTMLCEGKYCQKDLDLGLQYLDKAVAKGDTVAVRMRYLYCKPVRESFTDERYERMLTAFQKAADKGTIDMYMLYKGLKGGSDAQLARLGYVITAARNIGKPYYDQFKYLCADNGLPLIPACTKRANWRSLVRIDLNAFASKETYVAFSSDIGAENTLCRCHRLEKCGTAVYRSPAFGWLREEKHAVLLRIAPEKFLSGQPLQDEQEAFQLIPAEYVPRNTAFFSEVGEKEYSVEIAAITGDKVDVLLRYTIGGSDVVKSYFPPELVSINID